MALPVLHPCYPAMAQRDNGRWLQLESAPFSPRAHMLAKLILPEPEEWDLWEEGAQWRYVKPPYLEEAVELRYFLFGGQVDHVCQQPVLGVCSREVWELTIIRSSSPPQLTWSKQQVGSLPQPARCGAALIHDERRMTAQQHRIIGLVGGQVSFDPDRCTAEVVTVNEAWYASTSNLSMWRRGGDAPFSPRQSMVEDDAFLNVNEVRNIIADPSTGGLPQTLGVHLDKSVSLAGGIRYIAFRINNDTGAAIMTLAEVYSDVWSCTLLMPEHSEAGDPFDCDWHHSFPIANFSDASPALPSGSLPLPIAHAPSMGFPYAYTREQLIRVGGLTSLRAIQAWQSIPPFGVADGFSGNQWVQKVATNISILRQPITNPAWPLDSTYLSSWVVFTAPPTTVDDTRGGPSVLPLAWLMDETELNDPEGSEWLTAHHPDVSLSHKDVPMLTTVQPQPRELLTFPNQSTLWHYQSSDSRNTSRPLFDFSLRRIHHGMAVTRYSTIISGGVSSGLFSNDWITLYPQTCVWPDDASHRAMLGPIIAKGDPFIIWVQSPTWVHAFGDSSGEVELEEDSVFPWQTMDVLAGHRVPVGCPAGYHFDPPINKDMLELTCMRTGQWLDTTLGSVRRCVKNRECWWPFVDAGFGECADPLPEINALRVLVSNPHSGMASQPRTSPFSAVLLPSDALEVVTSTRRLVLRGAFFQEPLKIDFCLHPQLHNVTRHCNGPQGQEDTICRSFASTVSCLLQPQRLGDISRFTVSVGKREVTAAITAGTSWHDGQGVPQLAFAALSLLTTAPTIVTVRSDACQPAPNGQGIQLINCPDEGPFSLDICVAAMGDVFNLGFRLQPSDASEDLPVLVDAWPELYSAATDMPCDSRLPGWGNCSQAVLCTHVQATMKLTEHTIEYWSYESTNMVQLQTTLPPQLSVRPCGAGNFTNFTAAAISLRSRCQRCPAGSSTNNLSDQEVCVPCSRGQYSQTGWAVCLPCVEDEYAPNMGMDRCLPCGANAWQSSGGSVRCNQCEDGQYRVVRVANGTDASNVTGGTRSSTCSLCPDGAQCSSDGVLWAAEGQWLLVNNAAGTVSSVECGAQACLGATSSDWCAAAGADFIKENHTSDNVLSRISRPLGDAAVDGVQVIALSGIGVVNCCAPGRLPAASAAAGVNVLCSACVDGWVEVGEHCVPCSGVQWTWAVLLALFGMALLLLIHRFSQQADSATLSICMYFVQMSLLTLGTDLLPFWAALATISLDTSAVSSRCIIPLSAYEKIRARMVTPVVALAVLLLLFSAQTAVRALLNAMGGMSMRSIRALRVTLRLYALLPRTMRAESGLNGDNGHQPVHLLQPHPPTSAQLNQQRKRSAGYRTLTVPGLNRSLLLLDEHAGPADWQKDDLGSGEVLTDQGSVSSADTMVHSMSPNDCGHSVSTLADTAADSVASQLPDGRSSYSGDSVRIVWLAWRRSAVQLLLFSYNSLTTACLASLHVRSVGEFGGRLVQYPAIDTATVAYRVQAAVSVSLLAVAVVGCPIALLVWLAWCRRRRIHQPTAADNADDSAGAHICNAVEPTSWEEQSIEELLIRPYRTDFWFWTPLVLMRRLLFILIFTFAEPATFVWMTVANSFFLQLHIGLWPYRRRKDNALELLCLSSLTLQSALLAAFPTRQNRPAAVSGWLVALFIIPAMCGLLVALAALVDRAVQWFRALTTQTATTTVERGAATDNCAPLTESDLLLQSAVSEGDVRGRSHEERKEQSNNEQ